MEITSDKMKLRPLNEGDVPSLTRLCNNKKIWDNVRDQFPHPYGEQDAMNFIRKVANEDPVLTFAIEVNDELVGCIGFIPQEDIYRLSAEIGYWIGEPFWGNGYATKAIKLLTSYGFTDLGLVRIFAGCFSYNLASQRALLKAGYIQEAVGKNAVFKNGELCDEIKLVRLKPET